MPAAIAASLVLVGAVAVGAGVVASGDDGPVAPPRTQGAPTESTTTTAPTTTVPASTTTAAPAPSPPPVRLEVPAIGVATDVIDIGLTPDGEVAVPDDFDRAAWFRLGPSPGDRGPSVIVGHVDSYQGPAVFFRLGELTPGATVSVTLADGDVRSFVVERLERVPKDAFPRRAVYGDTAGAELRLVTCGGEFDESARSYRDNVIVYARAL